MADTFRRRPSSAPWWPTTATTALTGSARARCRGFMAPITAGAGC